MLGKTQKIKRRTQAYKLQIRLITLEFFASFSATELSFQKRK